MLRSTGVNAALFSGFVQPWRWPTVTPERSRRPRDLRAGLASVRGLTDTSAVATKGTVYLLDTSFFIFRAYHALPPLTTSTGLPTNAVQGVSTMLEKLIRDKKPVWMGCCFDTARATFRRELFPAYKANRLEPDEELRVQFPYVRRLVAALEVPVLDREGFEADDILATLAKRFEDEGFDVVLVTGDKDLMQCVTDRTTLLDPMRDLHVTRAEVFEKFGVGPEGVPEVLGLMGDSSDNIPGVKGVGPKTASALIAHFGTIEAMLARSEEIEKLPIRGAASVRKKIEEGAEMARLCRHLAEVRRDVPIDVTPEQLHLGHLATDELESLAAELEMHRLVPRMRALAVDAGLMPHEPRASKPTPPPRMEATPAPVEATRNSTDAPSRGDSPRTAPQGELALGAASTVSAKPEDPDDPLAELRDGPLLVASVEDAHGGWSLALGDGSKRSFFEGRERIAEALAGLAARGVALIGHDLKALCREFGAKPGAAGFDLGVASYLCDPEAGDHSFEDVCRRFLGEQAADPATSARGLDQTSRAFDMLEAQLEVRELSGLYRELEHPLVSILGAIEAHGVLLDSGALATMSASLEARMTELVERVYEAAGGPFNILSPVQLRQILYDKLGLPTKGIKQTKTGASTDSDALESLADKHPLPALVLEYRGLAKLKSTYVDALPRLVDGAGRIHTRLHQTVAATGRLSSSDPNLQNIPVRTEEGARIRAAFVAPEGWRLVSADYNQIELRVLAHLSADENLIEAFRSGEDIHTATAADMLEVELSAVTPSMRREAKVVNYGIIYGMGPQRLSRELGIPRTKAEDYIKRYFEKFPKVQVFYQAMLEQARTMGFVSTLMGRRRYLHDITSDHGGRRQVAERVATNTPIQGSAADIIKKAMVDLDLALSKSGLATRLVLQIHDELLLESPVAEVDEASRLVAVTMEKAVELLVPVVVDVGHGRNWAEAH
jgi:DNA polymerase-1